jgi:hypothetical protein
MAESTELLSFQLEDSFISTLLSILNGKIYDTYGNKLAPLIENDTSKRNV